MNEIKVLISFEKRINRIIGVDLTSGDYNSTRLIFDFDRQDGTKVFELKNPKGELVFAKEIENNEIILARVNEDGTYSSLFDMSGEYIFEVSLYTEDSKLTSEYEILPVEPEQVVIGDTVVEPYLPIFDELIQKVNTAINETNNLDIDIENSVITITKKDGTKISENVKGEPGQQGRPGSVKTIPVNEFPTENIEEDAIYILPNPNPTSEKDKYQEFIYINGGWELFGGGSVGVDLTDYVKNTDYATQIKGGVVKCYNVSSAARGIYLTTEGFLSLKNASNVEIDKKTDTYKPITPSNLDYAVKSVVGGHITLTQSEYDDLTTKDENTYYFIVEE